MQCPSPSGYTAQKYAIGKHSKLFSEEECLKEYMTKKRHIILVRRHVEIEENAFILQNRCQGKVISEGLDFEVGF